MGTLSPQDDFAYRPAKPDFVTEKSKLQMEYKLVLHTCPDLWKPAFSDRFLWDLTKFFEPEVGVLAGSLTCEGGSLRQCLLLTPEASLLRSFASEPF